MIAQLRGTVVASTGSEVTLQTAGGVGYGLYVSRRAAGMCALGSEVTVETYLAVREDALDLFGFADRHEKNLFKQFLSVSGVGPKTAVHLLGLGTVAEISSAIARGDTEYLTKVSGVGKKIAERIVVELRSKLEDLSWSETPGAAEHTQAGAAKDAVDGLVALGYALHDARSIVKTLDPAGKSSEELLREALRSIKK